MIKRLIISFLAIGLVSGCFPYRNIPCVEYHYETNEMVECLTPGRDYSIFEYRSPFVGVADNEKHIPAHYQILLPHQKNMKKIYAISDDLCFVYSKSRGVAIIQQIANRSDEYENGLHEIAGAEAERWLSKVVDYWDAVIKVRDDRHHYLYKNDEIVIVMFNLSLNDYHDFVELPTENLRFYRRGEVRLMD